MSELFEPWGQKPLPLPSNTRPAPSLTTPTHVAQWHRKPVGYHFCVGARAGGSNSRSLTGSTSQNTTEILPAPQSAAKILPGCGNWLGARP